MSPEGSKIDPQSYLKSSPREVQNRPQEGPKSSPGGSKMVFQRPLGSSWRPFGWPSRCWSVFFIDFKAHVGSMLEAKMVQNGSQTGLSNAYVFQEALVGLLGSILRWFWCHFGGPNACKTHALGRRKSRHELSRLWCGGEAAINEFQKLGNMFKHQTH